MTSDLEQRNSIISFRAIPLPLQPSAFRFVLQLAREFSQAHERNTKGFSNSFLGTIPDFHDQ
jgi:hypothetical protein